MPKDHAMTLLKPPFFQSNPLNSLYIKSLVVVVFCVIAVVATIVMMEKKSRVEATHQSLNNRAEEVTSLLAQQLGGAIKFGNLPVLEQNLEGVIAQAQPDLAGSLVVNGAGELLLSQTSSMSGAQDMEPAQALAAAALQTGEMQQSADGLTVAYLVRFGDAGDIVGAVVTSWSDAAIMTALAEQEREALLVGFAVMSVALVFAGFFLLTQMSRPLIRVETAMGAVAGGDYDSAVPFTARGDEVGKMARRLDTFRLALAEAKLAARESAFKGAAFNGSSAAMMMVDDGLNVIFANPTCEAFFKTFHDVLSPEWADIRSGTILGAKLSNFGKLKKQMLEIETKGADAFPITHTAKIGDVLLRVNMNAALDGNGKMIGTVIEWSDRTKTVRNAAVLDSIDQNQIRIEFNAAGHVSGANAKASDHLGLEAEALQSRTFVQLFRGTANGMQSSEALAQMVMSGQPAFGRFVVANGTSGTSGTFEGSFAAVMNPDETVERVIFLGTDVTETAETMLRNEQERKRIAAEQVKVVDALGVGLQGLAEGDLTCDIISEFPPEYEKLRTDFNAAVGSLRDAVSAVMHNADSIRSETKEITTAADDLSRRTEKQAATLEETAAALDELTSSVRSAAEGADQASEMSADAQSNAEKGGEIARQAVLAMDGIKNSSQEISKITSVIDDIAFQTNLLALNAGVEAARAGEAGRGFAVVATEVRALAQRSSDAAREINALISSSGDQVHQGVELVDKTGAALASIVVSVSEISKRVSNIAASAREQSSGLNEINSAVNELDHVTQQNAAMFEETTAASHALTTETDALASAVARFRLGDAVRSIKAPAMKTSTSESKPKAAITQGNLAVKVETEAEIDAGWEEF